jgi:hypothetical protein
MRLPAISTHGSSHGVYYDLHEYFDPKVNLFFDSTHGNVDAHNGFITIGQAVYIANAVCAGLEDTTGIQRSIGYKHGTSNTGNALYSPMYDAIFRCLPAWLQYLIFSTTIQPIAQVEANSDGSRTYKFHALINSPVSVSYHESTRQQRTVEFIATLSGTNNACTFTEEQTQALVTALAPVAEICHAAFAAVTNKSVYLGDRCVPNIVSLMYNYANDAIVFAPDGEEEDFSITYDWYRPSMMRMMMVDDGIVLNITPSGDFTNVRYTETLTGVNTRRKFERVFNYSANVLSHLPYTIKGPKEQNATLYGVELEANSEYRAPEVIKAQKDLFFLLKSDSTVSGQYSQNYEMVTVPCTLRAHKRLWAEFFEKIDYNKFDTTKDTGNGMHVHIDKKTFSASHLHRFTWFFINPGHNDFIYLMSERPSKTNFDQWARISAVPTNISYEKAVRRAFNINRGRGAVHHKGPTVEIRIFKGLVSYATIVKNLEFVDSVVEYTRWDTANHMSLARYFYWLDNITQKNQYTLLKAYYSEFKLEPYLNAAELERLVWGMTDVAKITKKLNSAPFTVTNKHLTILNKRRKKRTFVLNKKSGEVECLVKNTGVLSKLDQLAQKKQTRGSASFVTSSL